MKFNKHMNGKEIIRSVLDVLSDIPEATVVGYETREYSALEQVTERIRLELPNGLQFEFYIQSKMTKPGAV